MIKRLVGLLLLRLFPVLSKFFGLMMLHQ